MTELTPRNSFPFPSERERPFFSSFKAGVLAEDAAMFANADNSNIIFTGGGTVSWDAANDLLFWTDTIVVNGSHTPFGGFIASASLEIQDGEVIFFEFPRLVQIQNTELELFRSSRIFKEGTRLHDLRLFCKRVGDTIFFMHGLSLKDGDTGTLWGQGLLPLPTVIPHEHEDPWLFIAPGPGLTQLTPLPVLTSPDLVAVEVYKNGQRLIEGATEDFTVDLGTGIITLAVATVVVPNPDKFVVLRRTRDTSGVTISSHDHLPPLLIKPTPATTVLNTLVVSPILLHVDVDKNGQRLIEGAGEDFTVDLTLGLVTLIVPSAAGDKFVLHRRIAVP